MYVTHIFANTLVNAHSNAMYVGKRSGPATHTISTCGSTKVKNHIPVNTVEKHFVGQMGLKFISESIQVKNHMPVIYVVGALHKSKI
jgi:hypothetical protein